MALTRRWARVSVGHSSPDGNCKPGESIPTVALRQVCLEVCSCEQGSTWNMRTLQIQGGQRKHVSQDLRQAACKTSPKGHDMT